LHHRIHSGSMARTRFGAAHVFRFVAELVEDLADFLLGGGILYLIARQLLLDPSVVSRPVMKLLGRELIKVGAIKSSYDPPD